MEQEEGCVPLLLLPLLLLPWPAQTFSRQGASGSLAEAPGRASGFEASDISA